MKSSGYETANYKGAEKKILKVMQSYAVPVTAYDLVKETGYPHHVVCRRLRTLESKKKIRQRGIKKMKRLPNIKPKLYEAI